MSSRVKLQNGYVSLEGTQLYYEEAGQGEPLVMLHAGIADRRMWDAQMDAFGEHYRTIRFDTGGYGNSTLGEQPATRVQELHDLLRALGVESVILLGCSQGGTTAIDFALAHPAMTRALIVVAAVPSGYEFSGDMPPIMGAFIGAVQSGNLDEAAELATQIWFDGPQRTPEQVDAEPRRAVRAITRDVFASGNMDMTGAYSPEQTAVDRLERIGVPTLIMVGDQDAPGLVQVSVEMATDIPGAQRVTIADAAHLPSVEQPAQFNAGVLSFLRQRDG